MLVAKSMFLGVGTGGGDYWSTSPAVDMAGGNMIQLELLTLSWYQASGAAALDVYVEVSDDLETWYDWSGSTPTAAASFTRASEQVAKAGISGITQITRRFVRLKYHFSHATVEASCVLRARVTPTVANFS